MHLPKVIGGIPVDYELNVDPLDVDNLDEVRKLALLSTLCGLSKKSPKVHVTAGGPKLTQKEGSQHGFFPASRAHMKEVQSLPKLVGMVKKTLFDHTAHAIEKEKSVTSPMTHVVAEPKPQWSSFILTPPQIVYCHSLPLHVIGRPERVTASRLQVCAPATVPPSWKGPASLQHTGIWSQEITAGSTLGISESSVH